VTREDLTGGYPFPPSRDQLEQHERDMDRIRQQVADERGISVDDLVSEIEADDMK
jgi:hypothetical protein